jgi:hypothetical protein
VPSELEESLTIRNAVLRLNARAWGISFGLLAGLGLFGATLYLVIKGGENVGQHLQLLAVFFPGYRVTGVGAFIGLVYGFVVGYGVGRLIGTLYNRLVR